MNKVIYIICETSKTRVKLNRNFTWPHANTYTNFSLGKNEIYHHI